MVQKSFVIVVNHNNALATSFSNNKYTTVSSYSCYKNITYTGLLMYVCFLFNV